MSNGTYLKGDGEILQIEEVAGQSPSASVGSMTITPELLVQLCNRSGHEVRPKKYPNAGAMGFMGFSISCATFAMVLMGWGGATTPVSVAGIFLVTGPLLLLLATIFEWIAGNFLSMMICAFFCVFWGSFAPLQLPSVGIAASYSPTGNAAEGAISTGYAVGLALYLASMACAIFTIFIFTLKTNVVIASIFFLSTIGVSFLSAAYWNLSWGNFARATQYQHTGGALLFALAILGWYMTFVIMVYEVGMPFKPPVGDLSRLWNRPSEDVEKQE